MSEAPVPTGNSSRRLKAKRLTAALAALVLLSQIAYFLLNPPQWLIMTLLGSSLVLTVWAGFVWIDVEDEETIGSTDSDGSDRDAR